MKLISGVRHKWHKLWSMRFILLTGFLTGSMGAFSMMPAEWQAAIPNWLIKAFAVSSFLSAGLAGVSRIIHQPRLKEEGKQGEEGK